MYFMLMFVWHTGAAVVGDEACALQLFLCGAAVLLLLLLLLVVVLLLLLFYICFWRARPGGGRWAQGAIAGESHSSSTNPRPGNSPCHV